MIKDIKQISTAKGDKGTSVSYDNETYSKDDILFDTLGVIDELSSHLGLCFHHTNYIELKMIQQTLQDIMSLVATFDHDRRNRLTSISESDVLLLEDTEKKYLETTEIGNQFVLPGTESVASAHLDIARTITRRAERKLVSFIEKYQRFDLFKSLKYINRLSDLLYIMARQK